MKKLIISLLFCLLLCGCAATDPGEKYLVSAVGVERAGEEVVLYYKITDTASSNRVGEQKIKVLSAKDKSIVSAADKINLGTPFSVTFSHCEILFVCDDNDSALFMETLDFCRKNEFPLKTKLAIAENIENLFSNENNLSGKELIGMLEVVAKNYGFGEHTSLFEIETAVKINGGNFALPYFRNRDNSVRVIGLGIFKNCNLSKLINPKESQEYVKQNKI